MGLDIFLQIPSTVSWKDPDGVTVFRGLKSEYSLNISLEYLLSQFIDYRLRVQLKP